MYGEDERDGGRGRKEKKRGRDKRERERGSKMESVGKMQTKGEQEEEKLGDERLEEKALAKEGNERQERV